MEGGISGIQPRSGRSSSLGFEAGAVPFTLQVNEDHLPNAGPTSRPMTPNADELRDSLHTVRFSKTLEEDEEAKEDANRKKAKKDSHIVRFGFIPPRGVVGKLLTRLLTVFVWYGVLWGIFGQQALPAAPLQRHGAGEGCGEAEMEHHPRNCTLNLSYSLDSHCPSVYSNSTLQVYVDSYLFSHTFAYDNSSNETCTDSELKDYEKCLSDCVCEGGIAHSGSHAGETSFEAIENGHFFGLFTLVIVSSFFGFLAHLLRLPHLFGMMLGGILLNNIPVVGVARNINHSWSNTIRSCALVIVLIRGGLSMNEGALKKLFLPIATLGILPCMFEAMTIFLITFGWVYGPPATGWSPGLLQGFLNSAISPSVLVPSLLNLEDHGYGVVKGIPTMLIVSAAFDDVICISLFGVFLALTFSSSSSISTIIFSAFRGPMEVLLGLLYGGIIGAMLWYIPPKDFKEGSIVRNRLALLIGFGLLAFFGAQRMAFFDSPGFIGAGALGILSLAFIASIGWKRGLCTKKTIDRSFFIIWQFIEPLLFGLIGAEVDFGNIAPELVGQAFVTVLGGVAVRLSVVFIISLFLKFTWKERIFICICWLPKATIQAAISGIPLDLVMGSGSCDPAVLKLARTIQTLAIFEIVIAAPIGALLIGVTGPRLLEKSGVDVREEERNQPTEEEIEEQQWIMEHPDMNMDHYHKTHHHDLFELHDPIPEVVHWSEEHCLGCLHNVVMCCKSQKGDYSMDEPRITKKVRHLSYLPPQTPDSSNPSRSISPNPSPKMFRRSPIPPTKPVPNTSATPPPSPRTSYAHLPTLLERQLSPSHVTFASPREDASSTSPILPAQANRHEFRFSSTSSDEVMNTMV